MPVVHVYQQAQMPDSNPPEVVPPQYVLKISLPDRYDVICNKYSTYRTLKMAPENTIQELLGTLREKYQLPQMLSSSNSSTSINNNNNNNSNESKTTISSTSPNPISGAKRLSIKKPFWVKPGISEGDEKDTNNNSSISVVNGDVPFGLFVCAGLDHIDLGFWLEETQHLSRYSLSLKVKLFYY